jgi:hypothetical protein
MDQIRKDPQRFFVKAFFKAWFAIQPEITNLETKILMWLTDNMDIANEVIFGKDEMEQLAKELKSTRRSIDSTFKGLLKRNPLLIVKVKYYCYMICPTIGIKNKDFNKIQFLFEAYEREDGAAILKYRTSIMSKGKTEVITEKVEESYWDKSKFI